MPPGRLDRANVSPPQTTVDLDMRPSTVLSMEIGPEAPEAAHRTLNIGGWGGGTNREIVFRVCVCVACVRTYVRARISLTLAESGPGVLLLLLLLPAGDRRHCSFCFVFFVSLLFFAFLCFSVLFLAFLCLSYVFLCFSLLFVAFLMFLFCFSLLLCCL